MYVQRQNLHSWRAPKNPSIRFLIIPSQPIGIGRYLRHTAGHKSSLRITGLGPNLLPTYEVPEWTESFTRCIELLHRFPDELIIKLAVKFKYDFAFRFRKFINCKSTLLCLRDHRVKSLCYFRSDY